MHIKLLLLKSMKHVILTEFLTLKPHLNKRSGIESKNYQIKQELAKCEG